MKSRRSSALLLVFLLVLAGVAAYGIQALRRPEGAPPVDFTDGLNGPSSPHLTIPFEAFALTPEGLLRAHAVTGRGFGNDRWVVKTVSGDYLSRDFVFEVDVTIPAGTEDLAYVGFGSGDRNPAYNYEPAGAFLFRIHSLTGLNRIDVAASLPAVEGPPREAGPDVYAFIEEIGRYTAGARTTFRIERAGNRVTMSIVGGASHTFDLSAYPGLFDEGDAYLFFGNSAEGTVFGNVRVGPRG